jgi:hypothetical protein
VSADGSLGATHHILATLAAHHVVLLVLHRASTSATHHLSHCGLHLY